MWFLSYRGLSGLIKARGSISSTWDLINVPSNTHAIIAKKSPFPKTASLVKEMASLVKEMASRPDSMESLRPKCHQRARRKQLSLKKSVFQQKSSNDGAIFNFAGYFGKLDA